MIGYGYKPYFVTGDDPALVHQAAGRHPGHGSSTRSASIQTAARSGRQDGAPGWPMIVLRTPKGWTGPKVVDGKQVEGTWRSHQVPLADTRTNADHRGQLEAWMRSYKPEELFDEGGALRPELAALAPTGKRRMGANPHANGGLLLRELIMPDFREYAVDVPKPGGSQQRGHRSGRQVRPRRDGPQPRQLPDVRAGRDGFEPLRGDLRGDRQGLGRRGDPPGRRGQRPHSGRPGHGSPLRAPVRGLARGLPADRPARHVQLLRSLHPHHRLDVQPARQVAEGDARHPVAPPDRLAQLRAVVARLAPGPQRLHPPGPGLHRSRRQQEGRDHPRLPAARRQHDALGHGPLPAQPQLRQRHRCRQAARAELAEHGSGDPALHPRHRHLGLGQQRPGRRARRSHGLLRRHPHAGDPGRGRPACGSTCPKSRSGSSTWST